LTPILTGLLAGSHGPSIGLDPKCGPHFDQAFPEAGDLLLLFSHHLHLAGQVLLLRFEFLNLVLQAGDPFVSLVQQLFIEQELGSELVLCRELLL
jgi:hypothetical protein